MRAQDLDIFVVGNPPPSFGGAYFIFVKITASNGIIGYGEVYANTFGPSATQACIRDVFERYFEGQSVFEIERIWREAYSSGFTQRPDVSMLGIVSGLEIALWDIIGKALEQPVYNLLGGKVREKLRSYTYLYPAEGEDNRIYSDPHLASERAKDYVAQGFTALKFDPAGPYTCLDPHQPRLLDLERSAEFCRLIRKAVGTKADLLFGTHGQFTPSGAIRMAETIAPYQPLWFEEPTPPELPEQMALVARQSAVPIATGERLTCKHEFARVLKAGAAHILQPATGRCGGILEGKKIAALAEAHYAQIAPHLYAGPIEALANIQLSACIPNFLILESIKTFDGFFAKLLDKKIEWEQGYVIPPREPGLGRNLNEEVARAHPYTGDALHLEMQRGDVWPL